MSIQYDLRENPFKQEEGKPVLYPGVVVKSTKDSKDLVEHIARHGAYSVGTMTGVLETLKEEIIEWLKDGHNVRIDGLGTFSLSLTAKEVTDRSDIRSSSIHVDKVHFRPSHELLKRLRSQASIERVEYGGFQTSSREYTTDERWAWLEGYLRDYGSITRMVYCERMGLTGTTASRELKKWVGEGKLTKEGRHSHVFYTLPKN